MRRDGSSEGPIVGIVRERAAGRSVAEIRREEDGISDATFATWRSRLGGADVADAGLRTPRARTGTGAWQRSRRSRCWTWRRCARPPATTADAQGEEGCRGLGDPGAPPGPR